VPKTWPPYTQNKAYLKLSTDLLNQNLDMKSENVDIGIRDELYNFWHVELDKLGNCNKYDSKETQQNYQSRMHSSDMALNKCLELIDNSTEYNHLREEFLTEYELCMNTLEANNKLKSPKFRNLFNTHCLDAIAMRRLVIEKSTCCNYNQTEIYSTICQINFDDTYSDLSIVRLAEKAVLLASSSFDAKPFSQTNLVFLVFTLEIYYFFYNI